MKSHLKPLSDDIIYTLKRAIQSSSRKYFKGSKLLSKLVISIVIITLMFLPTSFAILVYNIVVLIMAYIGVIDIYIKAAIIILLGILTCSTQFYFFIMGIWMLVILLKMDIKANN